MSTDWEKYSTPSETQQRGGKPAKEYAVVRLGVADVRLIPAQTVRHSPVNPSLDASGNRAHTDVSGPKEKKTQARAKFMEIYELLIPPG